MAKKKNQHYIPQFYLKYFSFENNCKEIGIYNLKQNIYVKNGPIKHQCSKNFFYGKDEIVENFLSQIEGIFAKTFKNINELQNINKRNREEIYELLTFILVTDLRSFTSIENLKSFPNRVNNLNLNINWPDITQEQSVKTMFSIIGDILPSILDLDYKIFVNKTPIPFITSDFPTAKYNLLYEKLPTYFSVTGYRSKGLLVFLPVTPTLTIVFFDNTTYKIGNKKETAIELTITNEINQLNLLQILNGNQNIFFNEIVDESYLSNLKQYSKKFVKPNTQQTYTAKLEKSDGTIDENNLIIHRQNDTFINLKIRCIKIHSGSKSKNIDTTRINLRN